MQYAYAAVGKSGRVVRGSAAAASIAALQRDLAGGGLSLIEAHLDLLGNLAAALRPKRLNRTLLIDLFGYLKGLLAMGMDMQSSWAAVSDAMQNRVAREAVSTIRHSISQGFTLAESMERTGVFPAVALGNIKAGEVSGSLERVFGALEEHYRAEQELAQQVAKAMMYPLISLVILFLIAVGLLTFVIPQLKEIFPPDPPLPTAILVFLSDSAVGYWWTVPAGAGLAWVAWWRMPNRTKSGIWEFLYRIWLIGPLLKNLALCNLFFSLALLLGAGVSVLQALEMVWSTTTSAAMRLKLQVVRELISKGGMFSDGFKDPFFPAVVPSVLRQGETVGALDTYLTRLATFLRDRARARLQTMATFIEPALLLVGGGMILFLALGIFLPIYGQMQSVGR